MWRKLAVHLVQHVLQCRLERLAVQGRAGLGQCGKQDCFVEAVAHDAKLPKVRAAAEEVFHARRDNEFSLRCLEDFTDPARHPEVAVLIEPAGVAAAVPAILDNFGRFLGFQVVTLHQALALELDFALIRNSHLHAVVHWLANAAGNRLIVLDPGASVYGIFGHAVAVSQSDAHFQEPVLHITGAWR